MGMREFLAFVLRLWLSVQEATVNIVIHPKKMMHWQLRSVCQVLVKKCTETHPFLKKSTFQRWFFLTARPPFFLFGVSVTTFTRFIRELEMVSEMFWRVLACFGRRLPSNTCF